jgi:hypothetical protein
MNSLSIGIFKRAFMFPFRNLGAVLRIGLFPALITLAVIYILFAGIIPQFAGGTPEDQMRQLMETMRWISIPLQILYIVVVSIFAVGIHRLIVRDEYPGWTIFRFGRYELAYAAMLLFLFVLYLVQQYAFLGTAWALGMIPASFLEPYPADPSAVMASYREVVTPALIGLLVAFVAVSLWINVRLALAFAHAAVTGQLSLSASWNAMRGNFWRFVAAFVILAVLVVIVYFVAGIVLTLAGTFAWMAVYGPPEPPADPMPTQNMLNTMFWIYVITVPVMGFFSAMFIALLSYAYKQLVEGRNIEAGY